MKRSKERQVVGIDVSKGWLDIAVHPGGEEWQVNQDPEGLAELVQRLAVLDPDLIVLEASGGYQGLAVSLLGEAGLPVAAVNPRKVRDFARSQGILAKTDRLDAGVIARYGLVSDVKPQPPATPEDLDMAALVARRRQLIQMRTAERQRLARARTNVRGRIERVIDMLNQELADMDRDLTQHIGQSPHWRERERLMRSVPGVGPALSITLLAELPELGALSHKAIASLVGLAPMARDSGLSRGPRFCWGGRARVRAALYMPTVAALRCNPALQGLYRRLLAQNKPRKVALVACMHKLLTILNAILRHNTPWNPNRLAIQNSC